MDVRAAAGTVLGKLLQQQGSLASVLPRYLERVPDRDRALLQEICYGTARWFPRLDCVLEQLLDKPLRNKDSDVKGLLLAGLYQLQTMRIPDHAVIHATVAATRPLKKPWAKGLTNALLRRYLRERETLENQVKTRPAYQTAHPQWLVTQIQRAWPDSAGDIFSANNQHPPLTLRVNLANTERDHYLAELAAAGIEARPTPFSSAGITLTHPVEVDTLPGFAEGQVSVQDEAAQLAAPLLELSPGLRVLDACAAPGGKTAHILEHAQGQWQGELDMLALDISETRLQRVAQNLARAGLSAQLKTGDASQPDSWWDGNPFDRILLDAPCSATGIIRRQPDIKLLRTPENLARLERTQWQLLTTLWPLLQPGGLLLYATCSILPPENSQLLSRFVAQTGDAIHEPLVLEAGLQQPCGRQLLPQTGGHDGFFYGKLRKSSEKPRRGQ